MTDSDVTFAYARDSSDPEEAVLMAFRPLRARMTELNDRLHLGLKWPYRAEQIVDELRSYDLSDARRLASGVDAVYEQVTDLNYRTDETGVTAEQSRQFIDDAEKLDQLLAAI